MKVLLLDDDAKPRDDLGRWLRRDCFAVNEAGTFRQTAELPLW